MLTLLTFAATRTEPSMSPFCVKAMCLLDMAGETWERKDLFDPTKMPMAKLPVLKTKDRLIPDSAQIQAFLEARGAEFYPWLDAEQRGQAHALIRMVEEHLRPGLAYDRWLDGRCWPLMRKEIFGALPAPLRAFVPGRVRAQVARDLRAHGIARFSPADRLARLGADLAALTVQLGEKPYLMGPDPTAADAATVPVLSMIRDLPGDTELRRALRGNAALMAYADRGRATIYPGRRDKVPGYGVIREVA